MGSTTSQEKAYRGTLIMRKSEHLRVAKDKLANFKQGKALLEAEITSNPDNVEYRFLRLTVQENAPKILKYTRNIGEDADMIHRYFYKLPVSVQHFVADYAEDSAYLNPAKLNKSGK